MIAGAPPGTRTPNSRIKSPLWTVMFHIGRCCHVSFYAVFSRLARAVVSPAAIGCDPVPEPSITHRSHIRCRLLGRRPQPWLILPITAWRQSSTPAALASAEAGENPHCWFYSLRAARSHRGEAGEVGADGRDRGFVFGLVKPEACKDVQGVLPVCAGLLVLV
jgi:hypothetical protein